VVGKADDPAARQTARAFIESNTVQVWLNRQLEGDRQLAPNLALDFDAEILNLATEMEMKLFHERFSFREIWTIQS